MRLSLYRFETGVETIGGNRVVYDLERGELREVASGTLLGGLSWLPDGSGFVYGSSSGGALLYRLDQVLRDATGLAVVVAENPLQCVALGTGRALEERKRLSNVLTSMY